MVTSVAHRLGMELSLVKGAGSDPECECHEQ
jgi:hypothetical protein